MTQAKRTSLPRLMLVLAATCIAGWWFKAHCGAKGWVGSIQYVTGCYSDAVPFWGLRGVAAGQLPYFEARIEYPVLTGALIWIEGLVTRLAFGAGANEWRFLDMVALANAALAAGVLAMLWRAGLEDRRLWAWAAAPVLVLYVGHNWDMLAVALAVAALLAARERRLVHAAATAGLGVAAKLFPIVILPLIGLEALTRGEGIARRVRQAAIVTGAAIGAWALVNAAPALLARENWAEFYTFSQARAGTAASVWEIAGSYGWPTSVEQRNLYAAVAFAAGYVVILALGWRKHGDRPWLLAGPVLAWFMLTNKVYSPQFDLWLYPVLLLTAPRLWPVAAFTLAGVGAYFAEFWWFATLDGVMQGVTPAHIALWAGLRAAAMLVLIADGVTRDAPAWLTLEPHDRSSSPRA
jgi:uncharacterized membrane protein